MGWDLRISDTLEDLAGNDASQDCALMPRFHPASARAALWLALFAFGASLALQDIRSYDYWWHLRTGALMAETGEVPRVDPYTFTVPGARWVDIHWLFQSGLYTLYSRGGHAAVVLAQAASVALLLALLAPLGYRRERPWVSALGLGLLLVAACDRFTPRPELPTFALLAAVLSLLDRFERRGDAWIYAVVPLQILWVNLHGLFALGIVACGAHLAAELARPFGRRGHLRRERIAPLARVTLLAVLASLVNPNGLDGALYPLQQLVMIGPAESRGALGSMIAELRPTLASLKPLPLAAFLGLAGLALAATGFNWRRARISDPLLLFSFLYLGLSARRNVAVFAVVAAPIFARNLNEALDARGRAPSPRAQTILAATAACVLALLCFDVVSDRFYARMGRFQTTGLGVVEDYNPVGAVDWIEKARPGGPIAHTMRDGGYLLWRLYPDYRAMSDGRLEVFGPETFTKLWFPTPERFRALDAEYRFGTVLLHYNRGGFDRVLAALYASPEWCLGFVDDVAAVFVRMTPEKRCPVPPVEVATVDPFPPIDGSRHKRDVGRYLARARFYAAAGETERALGVWNEALERFPDLPEGAALRARLEQHIRGKGKGGNGGKGGSPLR